MEGSALPNNAVDIYHKAQKMKSTAVRGVDFCVTATRYNLYVVLLETTYAQKAANVSKTRDYQEYSRTTWNVLNHNIE